MHFFILSISIERNFVYAIWRFINFLSSQDLLKNQHYILWKYHHSSASNFLILFDKTSKKNLWASTCCASCHWKWNLHELQWCNWSSLKVNITRLQRNHTVIRSEIGCHYSFIKSYLFMAWYQFKMASMSFAVTKNLYFNVI